MGWGRWTRTVCRVLNVEVTSPTAVALDMALTLVFTLCTSVQPRASYNMPFNVVSSFPCPTLGDRPIHLLSCF